eukprot:COSAG06_NODE_12984_length_1306_cov_0.990058_2_plen_94_part_01
MESDIGLSVACTSPETVALSPRMASTGGSREASAGAPTVGRQSLAGSIVHVREKICQSVSVDTPLALALSKALGSAIVSECDTRSDCIKSSFIN